MYVVVEHEISNPQSFWQAAEARMADIPAGVKLHQALPSHGGEKAVCLWEADSEEQVRSFVEETVGNVSHNTYFAVSADDAIGLPATARA